MLPETLKKKGVEIRKKKWAKSTGKEKEIHSNKTVNV